MALAAMAGAHEGLGFDHDGVWGCWCGCEKSRFGEEGIERCENMGGAVMVGDVGEGAQIAGWGGEVAEDGADEIVRGGGLDERAGRVGGEAFEGGGAGDGGQAVAGIVEQFDFQAGAGA